MFCRLGWHLTPELPGHSRSHSPWAQRAQTMALPKGARAELTPWRPQEHTHPHPTRQHYLEEPEPSLTRAAAASLPSWSCESYCRLRASIQGCSEGKDGQKPCSCPDHAPLQGEYLFPFSSYKCWEPDASHVAPAQRALMAFPLPAQQDRVSPKAGSNSSESPSHLHLLREGI